MLVKNLLNLSSNISIQLSIIRITSINLDQCSDNIGTSRSTSIDIFLCGAVTFNIRWINERSGH